MATRSTIAVEDADGTIVQVYCQWDGYLENNCILLLDNYKCFETAMCLVEGGNIRSLEKNIENVNYYYKDGKDWESEKPVMYSSFEDYKNSDQLQEFNYILRFDNEGNWNWWVNKKYSRANKFRLLKKMKMFKERQNESS